MHSIMKTVTDSHGEHEHVSHVAPVRMLVGVCAALLILTGITYAVSLVDFGEANLFVALAVAMIKATLVALFFMHLRYDRPFNSVVFFTALIFLVIFIGGSLKDTVANQPKIIQEEGTAMQGKYIPGEVAHRGGGAEGEPQK